MTQFVVDLRSVICTPNAEEIHSEDTFMYSVEAGSVELHSDCEGTEPAVFLTDARFTVRGPHRIQSVTAMASVCRLQTSDSAASNVPTVHFHSSLRTLSAKESKHSSSGDDVETRNSRHRAYIAQCREQLHRNLVRTPSTLQRIEIRLEALPVEEAQQRLEILALEYNESFYLFLRGIEEIESQDFRRILGERHKNTLVPWCTEGCRYCCMARQDWEAHIRITYKAMRSWFAEMEQRDRRTIEECGASIFSQFNSALGLDTLRDEAHIMQRRLLQERESGQRCTTITEEGLAWERDVLLPWESVMKSVRDFDEKMALREKHLQVLRIQDSLGLQERRVLRQQIVLTVEEERMARRQLAALEEVRRGQFFVKVGDVVTAAKIQSVQEEMRQLLVQRDELLEFQEQKIREEELSIVEKTRQAQNELVEEFKEIRKLKKAGAEKNPPAPICPKCGQPPIKDLFAHRLSECPERPTQCTKCEAVMKFATFEDHKQVCPSRVVQCTACSNHYKSQYLDEAHGPNCLRIQHARQLVNHTLKPVVPFTPLADSDAVDDVAGVAVTIPLISLTPLCLSQFQANTPSRPCTRSDDLGSEDSISTNRDSQKELTRRITQLDDAVITSFEDMARYLETKKVGDTVEVNCSDSMPLKVTVGTTIPLSEFRALLLMVHEDEAQFCKPEPKKKAKK